MFPDPFKKIDEKLDKKFTQLTEHIDTLIEEIRKLNKNLELLRESLIKKEK